MTSLAKIAEWREESSRARISALWEYCPEEFGELLDAYERLLNSQLELLKALTDQQRRELFTHFCKYCGSTDPGCRCWDDS